MECPSCNSYRLKPTKLDFGLPARICSKCNGILINLLTYRSWLETVPETLQAEPKAEIFAEDNDKALTCKKCKRIMLKYKISSETINHVDLCTHCDDAWLDYGEWNML
ncbi:MAG: hypothetical protein GTO02_05550, partial [Candidatus Dadabacteria bacterium]|nr:hypothetical protein [Candidatus Dadabacteria bacterium]